MNTWIKNIGMIFLNVFWFLGAQYIGMFLVMGLKGDEYAEKHSFFVMLLAYLIFLIPYVIRIKKNPIDDAYRLKQWREVFQYIGYGIVLWLISCVINGVLLPFFPEYDQEINTLFVTNEPILRFIVLVIGAPFVEEYLFRGKIQQRLSSLFGPHLAIVGQGLIFGLIHPFGLQKVYASFLGMGLGYIRFKKQSLIGPTIMHMSINGIAWLIAVLY